MNELQIDELFKKISKLLREKCLIAYDIGKNEGYLDGYDDGCKDRK